ncbi:MAG: hypothetical protein K2W95_35020 [Candidatus Obscuribacterales bacterium]|nr:hypothetical protein [Candidatus Obscuribacterales bacterium]
MRLISGILAGVVGIIVGAVACGLCGGLIGLLLGTPFLLSSAVGGAAVGGGIGFLVGLISGDAGFIAAQGLLESVLLVLVIMIPGLVKEVSPWFWVLLALVVTVIGGITLGAWLF